MTAEERQAAMRRLLMDALSLIDQNHPAIHGFHAAFDERAKLGWLPESGADRQNGFHAALDQVLFYAFWGSSPIDGAPVGADPSPDFWKDFVIAAVSCPTVPHIRRLLIDARERYGVTLAEMTPERLCEHLIYGLLVYGNRTRNGLSMSPDPW